MKKPLLAAVTLLSACIIHAQEFPYSLSTFQDEYVPLSKAIQLTPNSASWDDPSEGFYMMPIGFEFEMLGDSSSNVILIDPGCQVIIGANQDTVQAISPYFSDVRNADDDTVVSYIMYSTEGTPGSRIFKLEWRNVGFYNEFDATGEFTMFSNFQVWFYEGTHDIEFRYGPNTINDGTLIHDGWGSPLIFFVRDFIIETQLPSDSWSLRGNPEDPIVDVVDLYEVPELEDVLLGEPSEGTVYHFDTGIVGVNENEFEPAFNVFPTVADQYVITYLQSHDRTPLRVFDSNGSLIHSEILNHGNNMISVNTWASGTYYFTIGDGPAMFTERMIRK